MAAPLRLVLRNLYHEGKTSFCRIFKERKQEGLTFSQIRHSTSSPKEIKKFYKNAYIVEANDRFEINLDRNKLKTPNGNLFHVPNEALALAIATEWNSQEKTIKRHSMHLTALANTAIDNPTGRTKEDIVKALIHYLETDTICYRVSEPVDLVKAQNEEWEPILHWARDRFEIELESTTGLASRPVPAQTIENVEKYLMYYSDWALLGFDFGTEALKSLILMLSVVHRHVSVEQAVQLSRLEQLYQIEKWGNVEWSHDVDKYDLQMRLSAASLFIYWCSTNEKSATKRRRWISNQ